MKKSILTTVVLSLVGYASFAFAPVDTNKVSHNVKVIASPVLDIQMTSTADVEFNFTESKDYEDGIIKNAATELKVKSTKPWIVKAEGTTPNFSSALVANAEEVPVGALSIGTTELITPLIPAVTEPDLSPGALPGAVTVITPAIPAVYGSPTFTALTNSPGITAATGSKGGQGVAGNTFQLDYKMDPGFIAEDTYTMEVTYTISAQ